MGGVSPMSASAFANAAMVQVPQFPLRSPTPNDTMQCFKGITPQRSATPNEPMIHQPVPMRGQTVGILPAGRLRDQRNTHGHSAPSPCITPSMVVPERPQSAPGVPSAAMMIPRHFMNKELEHLLLQAMPDHYDD